MEKCVKILMYACKNFTHARKKSTRQSERLLYAY